MQRTDPYGEILLTIHFIKSQYLPWRRGKPSTQTRWVQAYPTICASRIHTVNAHKVPRESDTRRCIQKPEQKTREGWQNERFKPFRLPVFLQPSIKNKKKINQLTHSSTLCVWACTVVSLTQSHCWTHTYKTRPHLHADTCQGAPTSLSCKVSHMHAC